MTSRIDHSVSLNAFYRNLFNTKPKSPSEITKSDSENFLPKESKGFDEGITAKDLFLNPTFEDEKAFNENWVNDIYSRKKSKEKPYYYLIDKGYSEENSETIVNQGIANISRQKQWSSANEKKGKLGSTLVDGIILSGIAKEIFDSESVPKFLKTLIKLSHGAFRGIRNYNQYSIYNRPDDDAAMNCYQSDIYDNKAAGFFARISGFTEMKISPWALPLGELFPSRFSDPIKKLCTMPGSLWWRIRMPAYINQQFATDLFRWLFYITPALSGSQECKEKISEVNKRGNLSLSYILDRHYKNSGLMTKKDKTFFNFIKQIPKLTFGCFSSDIAKQKDSAKKLGETIAPGLGLYGFFAFITGTIGSIVSKILEKEIKVFDFITATAISSQQLIYFPKLVLPLFNKAKELELAVTKDEVKERYKNHKIEDVSELAGSMKKLSYLGSSALGLNLLNNLVKLKDFENPIIQKSLKIFDSISTDLISKFFSHRRHIWGKGFRVTNPEFYNPVQAEAKEPALAQT